MKSKSIVIRFTEEEHLSIKKFLLNHGITQQYAGFSMFRNLLKEGKKYLKTPIPKKIRH